MASVSDSESVARNGDDEVDDLFGGDDDVDLDDLFGGIENVDNDDVFGDLAAPEPVSALPGLLPDPESVAGNGGGDDLDDLFGGDDGVDVSDHFGVMTAPKHASASASASALLTFPTLPQPPLPAANPMQLSFPSPPLSRPRESQPEPSALFLPVASELSGARFSSHQVGHTSGGPAVSNQCFINRDITLWQTSSGQVQSGDSDGIDEAELEDLWEAVRTESQPVTTRSGSRACGNNQQRRALDQDKVMLLRDVEDFRHSDCMTTRDLLIPRRIVNDERVAELLFRYVTIKRDLPFSVSYARLELGKVQGEVFKKLLKNHVDKDPSLIATSTNGQMGTAAIMASKQLLLRTMFTILQVENWGLYFFGPDSETAGIRTKFWPTDSTTLLIHSAALLHRVIANKKQDARRIKARAAIGSFFFDTLGSPISLLSSRMASPYISEGSPISLSPSNSSPPASPAWSLDTYSETADPPSSSELDPPSPSAFDSD
ncbi:hypothetical protein B0H63DRAFT_268471 [Podospora didyma]|uniref:Uncharacterized protein n=1 Tax=Podospora didyma TaxID=330526 RepID=A0AAE0KEQ1_9PEZI|nr:hypothetical protein B0H63DRAFT_268471 [Podospora didyma]